MEKTVMALLVKSDKDSLKTMAYQVAQIATQCTKHDIQIIDCALTFGGVKNLINEIGKIDKNKSFDSVIIYSPSIFKEYEQFQEFAYEIQNEFHVMVRYIRSKI